jgi:uracil-DNA glycosylase family 4
LETDKENSVFFSDIFEEIRTSISLTKEMESRGIKFASGGRGRLKCCCPFPDHKDSSPSCFVWTSNDPESFYCFGCKKSGTVIDFVMYYGEDGQTQLNLKEAIEYLVKKYDIKTERLNIERIKNLPERYKKNEPPFFSKSLLVSEDIRNFMFGSVDLDRDFREISHFAKSIDNALFQRDYATIGTCDELVSKALKAFRKNDDLFKLRKQCSDCHFCDLRIGCKTPVFGSGSYSAKILMVWDMPRGNEGQFNKLTDYGIGKLLSSRVDRAKIDKNTFWYATCLCCSSKRDPKNEEVNTCIRSYFSKTLNVLDIKKIFVFGEKSKEYMFPDMVGDDYENMWWSKKNHHLYGKGYSFLFLPEVHRIFTKNDAVENVEEKFSAILREEALLFS